MEGKTPVSAGTFDERGGRAVVPIPQPVPDGAVVAVTVEDAGGASSPTLPMVAASAAGLGEPGALRRAR